MAGGQIIPSHHGETHVAENTEEGNPSWSRRQKKASGDVYTEAGRVNRSKRGKGSRERLPDKRNSLFRPRRQDRVRAV